MQDNNETDKINEWADTITGEYEVGKRISDMDMINKLGFTISKLADEYILNGKINPVLYITEDILVEANANLVLTYNKGNGLLRIIFQDTQLCIQIDYEDYNSRVISSDYTTDWVFVAMATDSFLQCHVLIDKYGEITFGRR